MSGLDAAARPSYVIGASVWASVLDKSACPNLGSAYLHQLKLKTENETSQP